jgi:hypothetical protein
MSTYVTVLSGDSLANKQFGPKDNVPSAEIIKTAGTPQMEWQAQTRPVNGLKDLEVVLNEIGDDHCACLILGYIKGTEDGLPYKLITRKELAKLLKVDDEGEALAGVHTVECQRYAARLKISFHPSSVILFDYDVVKGMPEELHYSTPEEWLKALRKMIPGMDAVGCLVAPSSSSRAMLNGKPVFDKCGFHAYVMVQDADDVERFRGELNAYAICTPYGFLRPIHNQDNGEVVAQWPWSITDTTVLSCERLVFDGRPKGWLGVDIAPVSIERIDGGCLDTSLTLITDDQLEELKKKTGNQISRHELKSGKRIIKAICGHNDTALTLDTSVDTEQGKMTVKEFWASKVKKLRCQAVFRPESDSWAAFLNTHDDGTPFLYDVGCQIKFTLSKSELARYTNKKKPENWRSSLMLTIVKPESLQEIEDAVQMAPELPIMEQQITQIVAPPGCGKTAVLMAAGGLWTARGYEVHYFQVDVGGADLKVYHQMAEDGGFTLHSTLDCSMNDLRVSLNKIATEARPGELKRMVFIIDTYKKIAADVLSKKNNSEVGEVFRRITQKGGTVIALGHCNKNRDNDGSLVFSGTQDVMDDCDALIVFDGVKDETARQVVVNAEFRKGRTVNDYPFGLVIHRGDCLANNWVEFNVPPDPNLAQLNAKEALRSRQEAVIGAVCTILENDGPMSQTDLVAAVQDWCAANLGFIPGEKRIRGILHRLQGDEWSCTVDPQKGNAKIYENNPDYSSKPEPEETVLTADDRNTGLLLNKTAVELDS